MLSLTRQQEEETVEVKADLSANRDPWTLNFETDATVRSFKLQKHEEYTVIRKKKKLQKNITSKLS